LRLSDAWISRFERLQDCAHLLRPAFGLGAMPAKHSHTAMEDVIFSHPLLAESLNTLFAMFDAT
jgi:hypothetical protein